MSVMSVHWSTVGTEGMMNALSVYSGDRWSDVSPLSLLCGLEELCLSWQSTVGPRGVTSVLSDYCRVGRSDICPVSLL
jgi:hypothetical protein